MKKIIIASVLLLLLFAGCVPDKKQRSMRKITTFIGIDVSASFMRTGNYDEAIRFLAYYIYGHINQAGDLKPLKALYVAPIGGFSPDEPKSFKPVSAFESKSVSRIERDLKEWLVEDQSITDFNAYFTKVKKLIQKKNLILTPINIVIVSDGVPSKIRGKGKNTRVYREKFSTIDVSQLEYLARNITVRLLYADPVVSEKWDSEVPRNRVRMWQVDDQVMHGWPEKVHQNKQVKDQAELWKWINENVDYRVRRRAF